MHEKLSQKATCFLVEAARILRIDAQILVRRYIFFTKGNQPSNNKSYEFTEQFGHNLGYLSGLHDFMFLLLVGYNLSFLPCTTILLRSTCLNHRFNMDSQNIPRTFDLRCRSACKVVFNFASSTRVLWSRMVRAGTVTCRESRLQQIPGYCSEVWFMMIHDLHGESWWYFEMQIVF
jgi:hypothetical protein